MKIDVIRDAKVPFLHISFLFFLVMSSLTESMICLLLLVVGNGAERYITNDTMSHIGLDPAILLCK